MTGYSMRAHFVENLDVKYEALKQQGPRLPDESEDRCHVFDSKMWRILIYTEMGPALDPYTAFDVAKIADAVCMLIPLSGWRRNALRVHYTLHSRSPFRDRGPIAQAVANFYDRDAADISESMINAGATIADRFRAELTKTMPSIRSMEPRIFSINVIPLVPTRTIRNPDPE